MLLLLCVGVLLVGLTWRASGDTYDVTASVLAPVPGAPATITSPADQTHFTATPITVTGTCPENTYVELERNNVFSGTAICGNGQTTYQIETDLSLGSNVLVAQVYNITNQPGPASAPITVWLDNPVQPATPVSPTSSVTQPGTVTTTSPGTTQGNAAPFSITARYQYQPRLSGQPFSLDLGLSGGVSPYAVTILWGDGKESTLVRSNTTDFSVTHIYISSERQHIYTVKVEAVDSAGSTAFLQLSEVVHGHSSIPIIGSLNNGGPSTQWMLLVWSTYCVVLLMVVSFWLGERQEYYNLFRHRIIHRHRA